MKSVHISCHPFCLLQSGFSIHFRGQLKANSSTSELKGIHMTEGNNLNIELKVNASVTLRVA